MRRRALFRSAGRAADLTLWRLGSHREALDTHFKNMGSERGAIPLEKIDYDTSPLKIFPGNPSPLSSSSFLFRGCRSVRNGVGAVVGGFLHEGTSTVANLVSLPIAAGKGADFEAATVPALGAFDQEEEGTHCYILCKQPDESMYYFMELFADQVRRTTLPAPAGGPPSRAAAGSGALLPPPSALLVIVV